MHIGTIGLGKLGYPLAAILAQNHKVISVDLLENPPVPPEPRLEELIETANLEVTTDYSKLRDTEAIYCIVPTPSVSDGTFTDIYVRNALDNLGEYKGVFNIVSTVMPHNTERLAEEYGMRITYNPEFIAIGNVVEGMLNPDFILLGADDKESGDLIERITETYTDAPIKRMDTVSAELVKLGLNTYITQKITYANIIGEVADKIGADAHKVLEAIGTDTRVGSKYFKPYGAFGGPCFPRDTIAFSSLAGDIPNFALQTDEINKHMAKKYGYHDDRPEYQNVL